MRRTLGALGAVIVATAAFALGPAPAGADGVFTGTVRDAITGLPVEGATVEIRQADGLTLVTSTTTEADGTFSAAVPGEEYAVYVGGTALGYESGFVGSSSPFEPYGRRVLSTFSEAATWAPGDLGDISLQTRVFTGTVRDAVSGLPVEGATVELRQADGLTVETSTATAADGTFSVQVLGEEYAVFVDGAAVGYEAGFVGGGASEPFGRPVVATFPEAATWAPGDLGDISLGSLGDLPGPVERLQLKSKTKGAGEITVTFGAPTTGATPTGYTMVCVGPDATSVTLPVESGTTYVGFDQGWNICSVVAESLSGPGAVAEDKVKVR